MRTLGLHRQRMTIWLMLWVWLLAMSSGVLSACLLTIADRSGGDAHGHATADLHGAGTSPESLQGPDHERAAGTEACLKFCADESSALSTGKVSIADLDGPLAAVVGPRLAGIAGDLLGTRRSLRQPAAQGPPLVIRFARLTR